jgi:hypothetical protein
MASAAKYAHEEAAESERPLRVCAEAGRKCVRNIQQYTILSVEWLALVDSLKQLSRLVQLEARMPANSKVGQAHGRNTDSDGTLWDQEAHENAIRILVEEAKVNLCVRMMHDYKVWQYDPARRSQTIQQALSTYEFNQTQLDQKCSTFEESLGVLLAKAFQHVETLQLMDIPMLIEHLAFVFTQCQGRDPCFPPAHSKIQETLVTFYFSSLMKHAEELNNKELLAKTKEHNLVQLAVHHVLNVKTECPDEVRQSAAEGFAALADNEDFMTEWQEFFADENGQLCRDKKMRFMLLDDHIVQEILKNQPEKKRDLRPLTDFFNTIRRAYGES